MLSKVKQQEKGFTIIEVLIVLVIAGLIMLIVFLAVPALQRNSRNTQRKNDVASVLGAVSEWSNNNNGRLPGQPTLPTGVTAANEEAAALSNAKLGIYSGQVTFVAGATTNTNATTESTVVVVRGAKCAANGDDATSTNATSRAFAAMYTVETGGTSDKVCQEG
jgi:prepilin-type N-terminal cleavage/methylation domain-containing protein